MKLTFYGAAQTITGSKHLIQSGDYKLLLDCGLLQSRQSVLEPQNQKFPFDPKEINAVILSHAHADHCGLLPRLIQQGFKGRIYGTAATLDVAKYILLDSASIQAEDCNYYNNHLAPGQEYIYPLYSRSEVEETLKYFEPIPYFKNSPQWTNLNQNIRFKFYDAGHILGSEIVYLEIKEGDQTKTLAYTGDLGRAKMPILRDPEYIQENVDSLFMECTYGGRFHRDFSQAENMLKQIIVQALKNKSKIIVPAFALGRTQELIYLIHKLTDEKFLPEIEIWIDSPLAEELMKVYAEHKEVYDAESAKDFPGKENIFSFKNLHYAKTVDESKALNRRRGPLMIISASGMCEGGRVLHHLKNNIEDDNNIVMITGYQAEGTLGQKIQAGVKTVEIYGQPFKVKAEIVTLDELSAHADQNDLLDYLAHVKNLRNLFLVHNEISRALEFQQAVLELYPQLKVYIPSFNQAVEL